LVKKNILIEVRYILITALFALLYFMYLGPRLVEENLTHSSPYTLLLTTLGALIPIVFIIAMFRTWFIKLWKSKQHTFSFAGFCLSIYHGIVVSFWMFMLGVSYVLSPVAVVTTFFVSLVIAYVKVIVRRTPKKLAEDIRLLFQACVKGFESFLPVFSQGCKDFYGVLKGRDMKPFFLFLFLTFLFGGTLIELFKWAVSIMWR
jgi:hypothetical protein